MAKQLSLGFKRNTIMQRDIVFFVRDLPEGFLLHDKNAFFMTAIDPGFEQILIRDTKQISELAIFLQPRKGSKVYCVGFRNDVEDESAAIERAWTGLQGILDAFAFVIERRLPEVCAVIQVRENDGQDAQLKVYRSNFWAHFHHPNSDSNEKWKERQKSLSNRLLRLVDIVSGRSSAHQNDLAYQLTYSSRMFSCGANSGTVGVEYLCKFSALEGLVCGPATANKRKLISERLTVLFSESERNVDADITELWDVRCEASHQAKAFYNCSIPDSNWIQAEVVLVEFYLVGMLVFALDNIEKAKTVDELWKNVRGYVLPTYALLERPADMPKLIVSKFIIPTPISVPGAGAFIDAIYQSQAPISPALQGGTEGRT